MVKLVHTQDGPNIMDVLEVLGLVPPTRLGQLLLADKHNHRRQLKSSLPLHTVPTRKRSLAEAAKILKTTVGKIKRILKVAKSQPEEVVNMKWGTGCQQQPLELSAEQKMWVTDPQRLREQVSLSLKARTDAFNNQFGQRISVTKFR